MNATHQSFGLPPDPAAPGAEHEHLAAAISALHSPGFMPALTGYINAVCPITGAFVTHLARSRPPAHLYDTVSSDRRSAVIEPYLKSAYHLDPFFDVFLSGPRDAVLRLRDVAPDRFRRSTYYRRYYGKIDLVDESAILVALPDGTAVFYSIGRNGGAPRFSTRDIAQLRARLGVIAALTRTHLAQAGPATTQGDLGEEVSRALSSFGESQLTPREREVATLILKGHSSASISEVTGIAVGTVKIHRRNLYRKLGISSQSELLSKFLETVGA